jgi:hypothetical protein
VCVNKNLEVVRKAGTCGVRRRQRRFGSLEGGGNGITTHPNIARCVRGGTAGHGITGGFTAELSKIGVTASIVYGLEGRTEPNAMDPRDRDARVAPSRADFRTHSANRSLLRRIYRIQTETSF